MLRDDIITAQERFSGNDFPSLVKAYIALGIVTYASIFKQARLLM